MRDEEALFELVDLPCARDLDVTSLVMAGKLDRANADSLVEHLSRGEALGKILRFSLFANR